MGRGGGGVVPFRVPLKGSVDGLLEGHRSKGWLRVPVPWQQTNGADSPFDEQQKI